jgi:hypothetical protein
MNNEQDSLFFNCMMTGLFVGIIDTLICLAYNIGYRNLTGYFPSMIINVSSLIFAVNLILLPTGMVYYVFLRAFRKGNGLYLAAILLLTGFLTWRSVEIVRFNDLRLDNGFRGLLTGIVLIMGISSACLPILIHNKKFLEHII